MALLQICYFTHHAPPAASCMLKQARLPDSTRQVRASSSSHSSISARRYRMAGGLGCRDSWRMNHHRKHDLPTPGVPVTACVMHTG
jgi:hypothetical protein